MVNDQLQNNKRMNTHTQKKATISFEMYLFPIFVENLFHFAYQLNFSPICSFIWNAVSGLRPFLAIVDLYTFLVSVCIYMLHVSVCECLY